MPPREWIPFNRVASLYFPNNPHQLLNTDLPEYDPRYSGQPTARARILSFPLETANPVVSQWPRVAPLVCEKLNAAGYTKYVIHVWRRRQLETLRQFDDTTIVIMVDHPIIVTTDLYTLLSEIRQVVGNYYIEMLQVTPAQEILWAYYEGVNAGLAAAGRLASQNAPVSAQSSVCQAGSLSNQRPRNS
ncbi:hypothetical protein Egran_03339 [Elaphomyces granulatus]|uniref:Uncharacterized protein n=1 Tax=Elaphomyces granulatus TaxID=519963 RepID=A0A232LXL5_9EURO|nr:hypothetical protein Egran_03339 [Elaphomyces granulatus]